MVEETQRRRACWGRPASRRPAKCLPVRTAPRRPPSRGLGRRRRDSNRFRGCSRRVRPAGRKMPRARVRPIRPAKATRRLRVWCSESDTWIRRGRDRCGRRIVTALEGNKMARSGRDGAALATWRLALSSPALLARWASPSSRRWWSSSRLPSARPYISRRWCWPSSRGLTSLFAGFVIGMIGVACRRVSRASPSA